MTEYPQGRYDVPVMFPRAEGESAENWTNRLSNEGSSRGVYRQCSINWHHECSQRFEGEDADCRCSCHLLIPDDIDDEGDDDETLVSDIRQSPEFRDIVEAARMWSHGLAMEIIPNADPSERAGYKEALETLENSIAALAGDDL
jgi:hypothetical protein